MQSGLMTRLPCSLNTKVPTNSALLERPNANLCKGIAPKLSSKSMQGQIGRRWQRIPSVCFHSFHFEDPMELGKFLIGDIGEITVPGSNRKIKHDPLQRTGVGVSRLGTSEAVAVGDYAFALNKLS
jgi:hypothetical protein